MAHIARSDLAVGRMARETSIMSSNAGRDRLPRTGRPVARCASSGRPSLSAGMGSMIELHIKAFFESGGKGLHRRQLRIETRVADRTHRTILVRDSIRDELVQMAANAGLMAGVFQFPRFSLAPVA